jgi:hypothetical protein
MKGEAKMTNEKMIYEEAKVEIVLLSEVDVIATSFAFEGEDDDLRSWG